MAVTYFCIGLFVRSLIHLCCIIICCLLCWPSLTSAHEQPLLGFWQTEDKDGVIEFYQCEDSFCGRFYWLEEDSLENPSLDDRNPDPEMKVRPLCGLTFLGGFKSNGDGSYEGGWLYSPRHGGMFSANLALKGRDSLELRGFVFITLLGGSQMWTRIGAPAPCPLLVKSHSS